MELNQCPFCGGEVVLGFGVYGWCFIKCNKCSAHVKFHDHQNSEEETIKTWNRRFSG